MALLPRTCARSGLGFSVSVEPAGGEFDEQSGVWPLDWLRSRPKEADADQTMNMDLVTGGAGFIGSHLVDRLLGSGRHVRVLDSFVVGNPRNLEQHRGNPRLEVIKADVADKPAVMAACEGVERIFHLAARADVVPSIQEPDAYFRANVDGTFAVVEAARRQRVQRLVYTASSSCYGIPSVYPTPEDTPADPRYPYALTKFLGEQTVLHWARVCGLPAVSVRLFNVF